MNENQSGQHWNQSSQNWQSNIQAGHREAARMVPDRAVLDHTLNADKDRPGEQIRATLEKTVQLDNGPKLPEGTMLLGRIGTDDMHETGTSKLALRFTQAVLKDGQRIPIKATIVGVYKPKSMNAEGYPVSPGDEVPNSWTDKTLAVDQINVLSGVDLHSKIASRNSGVFVSKTNDDVKLPAGSEIALAIAERNPSQNRAENAGYGVNNRWGNNGQNGQYANGQNGQYNNGQNGQYANGQNGQYANGQNSQYGNNANTTNPNGQYPNSGSNRSQSNPQNTTTPR